MSYIIKNNGETEYICSECMGEITEIMGYDKVLNVLEPQQIDSPITCACGRQE